MTLTKININWKAYKAQLKQNIPTELKRLNCWMLSNTQGHPISPHTGVMSDVGNPENWGSFEQCLKSLNDEQCYVSFVLHESNAYAVIDLDDKESKPASDKDKMRHSKIIEAFDSYTEWSKSGRGYHVFVKGDIPRGARRGNVEIYSNLRHIICTGDIVEENPKPIAERQIHLNSLYSEVTDHLPNFNQDFIYEDKAQVSPDEEILRMASNAENSEKFNLLLHSETEKILESGYWDSLSEADLALKGFFCFYSPNNEQVKRLYNLSELSKREKVVKRPDLIDYNISKIRSRELPPVDLSQLKFDRQSKPEPSFKTENHPKDSSVEFPEGLVGEIASYIFSSSIRPVKAVSLSAAISMFAGIVGRGYNISGTGLNLYTVLVGGTGIGKEGAHNGINRLFNAISEIFPHAEDFYGPGSFASGQAILRHTTDIPCYLSVQGEIGHLFKRICSPRANANDITLQRVLLDLYNKSGIKNSLKPSVYSDKEKNTKVIQAPCVSILGETTKSTLFDGLDMLSLTNGFIPRILFIEYTGGRPPKNPSAFHAPSENLVYQLSNLASVCHNANQQNIAFDIPMNTEAKQLIDDFGVFCDDRINHSSSIEETIQIYNRAELKVLKLSALVAIGVNSQNPMVTKSMAEWAISLIKHEIASWQSHFESGALGGLEEQQHDYVKKRFLSYVALEPKKRINSYKVAKAIADYDIIPYRYLYRTLNKVKCFASFPRGAEFALDSTLKTMKKCGEIEEIPRQEMMKLNISTPCYAIKNLS